MWIREVYYGVRRMGSIPPINRLIWMFVYYRVRRMGSITPTTNIVWLLLLLILATRGGVDDAPLYEIISIDQWPDCGIHNVCSYFRCFAGSSIGCYFTWIHNYRCPVCRPFGFCFLVCFAKKSSRCWLPDLWGVSCLVVSHSRIGIFFFKFELLVWFGVGSCLGLCYGVSSLSR